MWPGDPVGPPAALVDAQTSPSFRFTRRWHWDEPLLPAGVVGRIKTVTVLIPASAGAFPKPRSAEAELKSTRVFLRFVSRGQRVSGTLVPPSRRALPRGMPPPLAGSPAAWRGPVPAT